jgi:D-alanine transaminase
MGEAEVEEVVLVDDAGYVIEGCRSNLFVVDRDGALVAPNISRGAVAGLAQELVHERIPDVVIRDMSVDELDDAQEIIAVNAVRQAAPIVRLNHEPIGTGEPGAWQRRLSQELAGIS